MPYRLQVTDRAKPLHSEGNSSPLRCCTAARRRPVRRPPPKCPSPSQPARLNPAAAIRTTRRWQPIAGQPRGLRSDLLRRFDQVVRLTPVSRGRHTTIRTYIRLYVGLLTQTFWQGRKLWMDAADG